MNEPSEPLPETPETAAFRQVPQSKPLSYWLRRLLLCNPFYLVSAALLLFGIYRISVDPGFLKQELKQLSFNFVSLQTYELLLVITAIFLARRSIWYDSTLLVSLENLLVLVPFILISQAALIDQRVVWALCLIAGLIAAARFWGLKRWINELNFPRRFVAGGLLVLLVNVGLPVIYRILHESKIGTRPDWGAAYYTNKFAWILVLPALCTLANVLPARGLGPRPPQGRFLPLGLFALWLVATGVHLFSLGYVYDFALRPELTAPAAWILLWIGWRRLPELLPALPPAERKVFLVFPLLAPMLAAWQASKEIFLPLMILNTALYGAVYLRRPGDRLALHLAFISLMALVAGIPHDWARGLGGEFSRSQWVTLGLGGYFLLWTPFSRNPKIGLLATLLLILGIISLPGDRSYTVPAALQIGLAFLLAHSLRWAEEQHAGAGALRVIAAGAWVFHAWWWMHAGGTPGLACVAAGVVLAITLGLRMFAKVWGPVVVPIAALLVIVSSPGHAVAKTTANLPLGLLAIAGSFVLLGLGTLAALTKHRWAANKPPSH